MWVGGANGATSGVLFKHMPTRNMDLLKTFRWRLLNTDLCLYLRSLIDISKFQVGARLISHAGSLTNLAKYPASTLQILGAEKALFRALKTGCKMFSFE